MPTSTWGPVTSSTTTNFAIYNYGTTSTSQTLTNKIWNTYNVNSTALQGYWGYNQVSMSTERPRRDLDHRVVVDEGRVARSTARAIARDRADELLLSMLSEDQRQTYQLRGEFEVIGSAGGVYRIRRGTSGNVDWLEPDGRVGARLCAHPTMAEGWLPDQDVAVAQMLALITDEPGFVRLANVHAGRRPSHLVAA